MFFEVFLKFLLSGGQNLDPIGVFSGEESFASIIFNVWNGPGPKNLECNVFVTLKS